MQRVIAVPLVGMLLFAALGAALGIQGWIVVPFVLASGALLYSSYSRYPATKRSIPGSYHGKRAAWVLTVTAEAGALMSLTIDDWGPAVGLVTFSARIVFMAVWAMVGWMLYQRARQAWPAGSD